MPIPPTPADTPLSKLPNFDPRAVPVHGIDTHLPAVPAQSLTPQALRQRHPGTPCQRAGRPGVDPEAICSLLNRRLILIEQREHPVVARVPGP